MSQQPQKASLGRVIITPIILLVAGYLVAGLLGVMLAGVVGAIWILVASSRK